MSIRYGLYQNTNKNFSSYGKWYGRTVDNGVIDFDDFCQHIADHGTVYSRHDIAAILGMAIECAREQVLNGYRVDFGDMGKFYASITSTGADSASDYSTTSNVTKVAVKVQLKTAFSNLSKDASLTASVTNSEADDVKAARS